ncbi:MAG TPA: UdgX family uracil-DNA binding protein [Thermoanaerobaculia bacterium]|nr:UdgX family uracil-DNA binding protein [Thermoanaerobaculia bacterium]
MTEISYRAPEGPRRPIRRPASPGGLPSGMALEAPRSMSPSATARLPARSFLPQRPTLAALARAAQDCRACDLYQGATQAVLGAGPQGARAFFVGEQPGDQEDLQGRPFVGPAGKVLDEALAEAGIRRDEIYVTNAVKHFKWHPRGKKRIHQKPNLVEVRACRPWLEAELALVKPEGIVCLGATAAQSLMGPQFRITRDRGQFFDSGWARWLTATLHPSAILRMPDAAKKRQARDQLVEDLRKVAARLGVRLAVG